MQKTTMAAVAPGLIAVGGALTLAGKALQGEMPSFDQITTAVSALSIAFGLYHAADTAPPKP